MIYFFVFYFVGSFFSLILSYKKLKRFSKTKLVFICCLFIVFLTSWLFGFISVKKNKKE